MKFLVAAPALLGLAVAWRFQDSCIDIAVSSDEVLTARCDIGDHKGTRVDSSLQLNACLQYDTNTHQIGYRTATDNNFGSACSNCVTYQVPDPIYGECCGLKDQYINCTCSGASGEVSAEIDNIDNKFGTLYCS